MCGIVGYIGARQAWPILVQCLARLEYRGYDSCGIAAGGDLVEVSKCLGGVKSLKEGFPPLKGDFGIGHTRWATHGEPSKANAHPHIDCSGRFSVVHNGVIGNSLKLRSLLEAEGHRFTSDTDTEVLPHLIEKHYHGNLEEAVEKALTEIVGSYAVVAIAAGERKLVVARKDSPLIIGLGDRESFVASDTPAILDYTNRVLYLENGDIGVLTQDGVSVRRNGADVELPENKISWTVADAQKGGYEHFMLKEIHEQPRVIRDTLGDYTQREEQSLITRDNISSLILLACGSSYHAGMVGRYLIEELMGIPVRVEMASEFNHIPDIKGKAAIALTQSGETADTLKAMRVLKSLGCPVLAVTNVVGSSASRIADDTVYTRAGPEISVAATKSFMAQLMVLYWLAISQSSKSDLNRIASLLMEMRRLPSKLQQVLESEEEIAKHARYLASFENAFFIGRGIGLPVALEGALKLKEVAYIHAEGYPAGELKHGTFALLSENTPVVAVIPQDSTYKSMITSIKEIKARRAPVIAVTDDRDANIEALADIVLHAPHVDPLMSPIVNTVVLQLIAYYAAANRGCPIDNPRNLAKSVTVE